MNIVAQESRSAGAVLGEIFRAFDDGKIEWCAIGGYENYPESIATDLDILIQPSKFRDADRLLRDLADGLIVHRSLYGGRALAYTLYDPANGNSSRTFSIDMLAHSPFELDYNMPVAPIAELLKLRRKREDGLWVLPPDMEFLLYLAKRLAKLSFLTPEIAFGASQTAELTSLYRECPDACRKSIMTFFSANEVETVTNAAETGEWGAVIANAAALRSSFQLSALKRRPLAPLRHLLFKLYRWPDRLSRPNGLMIAILGPDGSGKTLIQSALAERLAPIFDRVEMLHLKPGIRRHPDIPEDISPDPHGVPARGAIRSIVQLLHWGLLYSFGYWLLIFPARIRQTLIISDRYHADLLCDPKRYRYGGPSWCARLLIAMLPAPDLWLVLDALPKTIYQRKAELPIETVRDLCVCYRRFAQAGSNRLLINANAPANEVADEATVSVLRWLANRPGHS
ncbi:MAG: hypothetical protein HQ502_19805 [Alphaproteobacteria bacterium]|nr:hypothetical protein [Alphaproteobacteria bacterium]